MKLKEIGFKTTPFIEKAKDIQKVIKICDEWEKKRDSLNFDIDGMVIKVNSFEYHHILGHTNKSPRWAIAYKFPTRQATTKIENIIVNVGRTGKITPVAILTPVPLSGTTVSRSTLHNEDEIHRKDIRVGDTAIIEKGGEIIPKELYDAPVPSYNDTPSRVRPVVQFDLDGKFIAEYANASEANRKTGVNNSHIGAVCKGLRKTAGGYIWKHKNEE